MGKTSYISPESKSLGLRMKEYEAEYGMRLNVNHPIIARLDGKNFHSWTRGLERPYDERLSEIMARTTEFLVEEFHCLAGYTQSDEISLTWNPYNIRGTAEQPLGGKVQKLTSILASYCTAYFNQVKQEYFEGFHFFTPAYFDARVFTVYGEGDGADYFVWRQRDAHINSISMAAQEYFSPTKLYQKNSDEKIIMLSKLGVDYHAYPEYFRKGVFVKRDKIVRKYTTEEIELLPPLHEARTNPDLEVERSVISRKIAPENRVDLRSWIYGA